MEEQTIQLAYCELCGNIQDALDKGCLLCPSPTVVPMEGETPIDRLEDFAPGVPLLAEIPEVPDPAPGGD